MNWLAIAILILLVALIFRLGLLAYAMYSLVAMILISRWLARQWANSVEAERTCDREEAEIGDQVTVTISLKNGGKLPIPWALVEDLLPLDALVFDPPNLQIKGRRATLTMVGAGSSKTIQYKLVCNRRGYYQIGPLVLETGDLFGLHRRYRILTEPDFLMVYPKIMPLEGYDISSRRPIGEVRMAHRLYEDPTRISGVRYYQPGDPLNRIHWRATARTATLHSKVFEPSSVSGATLILDFHRRGYPPQSQPFRSELAVTAAASIANALYEMGQQVGLITNGRDAADRIRTEGWAYDLRTRAAAQKAASMLPDSKRLRPILVETRRGPEQLVQILNNLARLELTNGLSFAELLLETRSRMPRDATIIAILSQVDEQSAIALGNLVRQGYAVTAMLNVYEADAYAMAAGQLLAQGIETRHLIDENSILSICQQAVLR